MSMGFQVELDKRQDIDATHVGGIGSNAHLDRMTDAGVMPGGRPMTNEEALDFCHPEYLNRITKWEKYTDCYEADNIYQYIFRHTRESDDIFTARVKRGYYYNYVASVVDLFVSYLYHSPINRNFGNLPQVDLEAFMKDANRSGDMFHIFIQMAATFAQMSGHCGILVDAPKGPDEGFKSEEDRKKAQFRPYGTLVQAQQIKDWEVDEFGRWNWVKLEMIRPEGRDWKKQPDENLRSFLIWSRDEWQEWEMTENEGGDMEAKLLDSGPNPLGEVPLVIVRNERCLSHNWMGLSTVRDIADINIAILNWSSLGDEEIYERCLNVLALERSEGDASVLLAHHNVLEYEPGTQPPQYLTPGESPLQLIGSWVERGKDEIYRLAKLGGSTGLQGVREATSGIAYAYEFNETNQSLAKKAKSLEQAETEVFRLFAKWLKVDWDGGVEYPQEFGVEDFVTEFQVLAEARTNFTSDTAVKEVEKKLAEKMFSKEKQTLRKKILDEIEAADPRGPGLLESFANIPAAPREPKEQDDGDKGSATGGVSRES